jgi:hypothetical protein
VNKSTSRPTNFRLRFGLLRIFLTILKITSISCMIISNSEDHPSPTQSHPINSANLHEQISLNSKKNSKLPPSNSSKSPQTPPNNWTDFFPNGSGTRNLLIVSQNLHLVSLPARQTMKFILDHKKPTAVLEK